MMKFSLRSQLLCAAAAVAIFAGAYAFAAWFYGTRVLVPEFNGLATVTAFGLAVMAQAIALGRLLHLIAPVGPGRYLVQDMKASAVLYGFLDMFHRGWLGPSKLVPLLLRPAFYKILGAKIGRDTMIGGMMSEPLFMTVGDRVAIGEGCVIGGHLYEAGVITLGTVEIEEDAVIGAGSMIMPGVRIGRGSIVAVLSVVKKGTVIPAGEIWGGVPAVKIRDVKPSAAQRTAA